MIRLLAVASLLMMAGLERVASAQPPADPLRQHFEAAQTFQLTNEFERAETEYTKEVIPRALERLAALANAEGTPDTAVSLLEQAIATNPESLDARVELAGVLFRQQSFVRARSIIGDVLARRAEYPRALGMEGKLDLVAGRPTQAVTELRQALAAQPDRDFSVALALALLRDKRPDDARVVFDEMMAAGTSPELHVRIGRAYLETGLFEEAIRQFKIAVERGPQLARAHHYLGVAYLLAGGAARASLAKDELTLAARINPDLPRTKDYLARLERGQQPNIVEPRESVLFDQPRVADPDRIAELKSQLAGVVATAYYNRGVIQSRRERFQAAADDMRLAARWKPDLEGLDRGWGVASYLAGNYAEAFDPLMRYLSAHPDDREAREMLDASAAQLGRAVASPAASAAIPGTDAAPSAVALDDIDRLIEQGKLEEAERAVWPVLQAQPSSAALSLRLARVRQRQHRESEAESLFQRALALDPTLVPAYLDMSTMYREEGQKENARQTLTAGLAAVPADPFIMCALAWMDLDEGQLDRALDAVGKIPEAKRPPEALVVLIGANLELGRTTDVQTLLATARTTADADSAAEIAERLLAHDLVDDALALTTAVNERLPASANLLVADARASGRTGNAQRAERDYERALALNADSVGALRGLASLASAQGNPARAVQLLMRARSASHDSPEVLGELVQAAMRAVGLDEALSAAKRLVELRPKDPQAAYLLGIAQLQAEDWPAAQATFANVVALNAPSALGHLGLGIAYFGRRDYGAAQTEFERTIVLDPRQAEAPYHLGLIAREEGLTRDGMARFEETLAIRENHVPARTALGALLIQEGNLERAQRELERAAAQDPTAPEPHYQLALLFTRLKDSGRAQREMAEFLRLREPQSQKP